MIRTLFGATSAVAVAALLAGAPGQAFSDESSAGCTPIVDGDGEPVIQSDGNMIAYSGSAPCAEKAATVAATETVVPEPAKTGPEAAVVYFDIGKAELNGEARTTINELVADLQGTNVSAVTIAGFTDTKGSPERNQRLAQERANNVASEFVKAGLPARVVGTAAFGEDDLAIKTGDNVAAQQNRRVEIKFAY